MSSESLISKWIFFLPTSSSAVCFVVRVHRQFSLDCISSFTSVCVCIIHKSTANFITNTITQVNFIGYLAEWETSDGETLALYHIHLPSPGPGRCLVVFMVICSCHEIIEHNQAQLQVSQERRDSRWMLSAGIDVYWQDSAKKAAQSQSARRGAAADQSLLLQSTKHRRILPPCCTGLITGAALVVFSLSLQKLSTMNCHVELFNAK